MKIVHVATTDAGNGAAIGAYRLHRGLKLARIESKMFVAEKRTDDPDVIAFQPPRDLRSRLSRRLRRTHIMRSMLRYRGVRSPDLEAFSDDRSQHGHDVVSQLPSGDVVNVHAMLDFVDYRSFFARVPTEIPVVRTLRDMSSFTGGCHYTGDCDKFTLRCGACPQLGSEEDDDLSRRIWERKHAAFTTVARTRLHLVATSTWMAREVRRSSLLRDFPVTIIPNALDTDVFAPRERDWARDLLGISRLARVVLFVAEPVSRRLKGFSHLARALEGLRSMPNLLLVSVGSGRPPAKSPVPHVHLGHIAHERLLSAVYSAADVFVIPSLQEAFGHTALEATACGTPVVGSAVGGILDTVRPGITGLLAAPGNVAELGNAISDVLGDSRAHAKLSENCRRVAVEEYSLPVHAERYARLYQALLMADQQLAS